MSIGYVMLGTNDLAQAREFYAPILELIGMGRVAPYCSEKREWFGAHGTTPPLLVITHTFDGEPATAGNGSMVALACKSKEMVDAGHATAIECGAADEGTPGPRGEGFYGAYFRDLDGNKVCLFFAG